jgi:hypothetical protein
VEGIEIVNCIISLCMVHRLSMEKRLFKIIALPGWSSQVFACHICYVILRHYFNSFGNFKRVLSKSTNYMHILASGPDWQAVYFGHAFHPKFRMLPPTLVRLNGDIFFPLQVFRPSHWQVQQVCQRTWWKEAPPYFFSARPRPHLQGEWRHDFNNV